MSLWFINISIFAVNIIFLHYRYFLLNHTHFFLLYKHFFKHVTLVTPILTPPLTSILTPLWYWPEEVVRRQYYHSPPVVLQQYLEEESSHLVKGAQYSAQRGEGVPVLKVWVSSHPWDDGLVPEWGHLSGRTTSWGEDKRLITNEQLCLHLYLYLYLYLSLYELL